MPRPIVRAGGGFAAIRYALRKGREAGGALALYRRLRSRNACKTCALGMGGQRGGMVNEAGAFPEVCKKSIQAQAGDMQAPLDEAFFRRHSVADLERFGSLELEYSGRLAFPVAWSAGATHFSRISWDAALDRLAGALRAADPARTFFYASGRSSNEAAFLLQTVARAYGTTNVHNCSCYCHNASSVALARMVGSGTATVVLDDLDRAELAFVAGANPASNHPRLVVKLVDLRSRGGKVIVLNPLRELGLVRFRIPSRPGSLLFGSDVSDVYLQPHVGSDIWALKALLKGVLERGAEDREFLARHVEGWEAVEADVRGLGWDELCGRCGLSRDALAPAIDALARSRRSVFLWAMGLTHHEHGVDNVLALGNLAAACGAVGREGAGLMPIRGHSNVQGVGSMGFTPALKRAFAEALARHYGIPQAAAPGLDTYGSMIAAHAGKIDAAVMLGGNLWGSNPDSDWAREALSRIGLTAYVTTKLNQGHVHGRGRETLLLPVLARDEEPQPTTQESGFNYVRMSDGGAPPAAGEARSEVALVCQLAARILPDGPIAFASLTSHRAIRAEIARVVPGFGAIGEIDDTRREFQIEGRTFHTPRFATASGKLQLAVPGAPRFELAPGEYRLTTLRSEGQFNTVVYEDEDVYRGNRRRDVVMLAAGDAAALGIEEGDAVEVTSAVGSMTVVAAVIDIPPGNVAMYYPEANRIVPRRVDAASGTPAFKSVAVRLAPQLASKDSTSSQVKRPASTS